MTRTPSPTFRRSRIWPAMPVKIARLQVGASALEVALTAGLTATRVSYIERGLAQPTPAETEALSAAIAKLAAGGAR